MTEYLSSLPIIAMDGRLRKRFNNTSFDERVYPKTGSLRDVRTIAGSAHDRCLHV
jgi:D-alanyl-D-alanine carboxypeptidase/D-alanyl-D-alanine-endopeptidase (penicillin-binding protein 4)